jgi:hypothetical protein
MQTLPSVADAASLDLNANTTAITAAGNSNAYSANAVAVEVSIRH